MLLIKAYIDSSKIEGLGLFAGEDLPQGTKIWEFTVGVDLSLEKEFVESHPNCAYFKKFGWVSLYSGKYIIPIDQCIYINHSLDPNCNSIFDDSIRESSVYVVRDIKKGEEITENYNLFENFNHQFSNDA